MRRDSRLVPTLIMAALCAACGSDAPQPTGTPTPPARVASVTVTATATSIAVGATTQLTATLKDSAGNELAGRTITWSSSDTTHGTVNAAGAATGVFPGAVTVSASSGGIVGQLALTIVAPTLKVGQNGPVGHFTGFAVDDDVDNLLDTYGFGYGYYSEIFPVNPSMAANTQLGWGTWFGPPGDPSLPGPICSNGQAFQSVEGGNGAWGNDRYASAWPHFGIVVTGNCSTIAVGAPAFQSDGDVLPTDQLGLAQLSNRLLLPPSHLGFTTTAGPTLFGYAYISLPLIPAHTSLLGQATGDQNWTLFLNTATLKGPVAFFTDEFFSAEGAREPNAVGHGLDQNKAIGSSIGLEICCTPSFDATVNGVTYRRIPPLTFSADASKRAVVLQDARLYAKSAVSDLVLAWLDGGSPVTQFNASGIRAVAIRQPKNFMYMGSHLVGLDTTQFKVATYQNAAGGYTFGFQWGGTMPADTLPQYYKLVDTSWTAITPSDVPRTSWLADQTFPVLQPSTFPLLDTGPTSPWTSAKWAAGPFTTTLANGSTVTYVWYKFIDQPAIARLGLSAAVLQRLQTWVESLHDQGTNALTFPGPSQGILATIDPALIVSPPPGMTRGYVPIVIGQR